MSHKPELLVADSSVLDTKSKAVDDVAWSVDCPLPQSIDLCIQPFSWRNFQLLVKNDH